MDPQIIQIISDPTIRAILGPAVGSGLRWAATSVRNKFAGAPSEVQKRASENADAFADLVAAKVAAKIQQDNSAREAVTEELSSPRGNASLQQDAEMASQIDDEFMRENLAELVARRLTAKGATRIQLASRIAVNSLSYLTEAHLRLLAFMVFVQHMQPSGPRSNQDEYTVTTLLYYDDIGSRLVLDADPRDLDLIASAGLVDVMSVVFPFDPQSALTTDTGITPQLGDFFTSEPLGRRIKAGMDTVMRHRLNLAGKVLGVTVYDKILGSETDISSL